jgi:hypothetical protein
MARANASDAATGTASTRATVLSNADAARIEQAMKRVQAPVKKCMVETAQEIKADTDWADLLAPSAFVPTAARALDTAAARARYTPERKLLLLDSLLDEPECLRLNEAAEAIGYGRTGYPKDYRGNLRLIITDLALARAMWERLRPFVPATLETADPVNGNAVWEAVGLNEVFRLAKYYPGDRFGAHCDAHFARSDDEKSFFTVNVYTNTVPAECGGKTRFYEERRLPRPPSMARLPAAGGGGARRLEEDTTDGIDLVVQPEAGLAAIFRHDPRSEILHDGEALCGEGSLKYLLRTDIMYRRVREAQQK